MKEQNNDMIRPEQRENSAGRITNYDNGAGETGPMIARLRAETYRYRKRKTRLGQVSTRAARHSPQHVRGLLNLGRQYDVQARDNFAKEAVLFGVILVVAVAWPAILSLKALAG